ncbi:hypothetical protein SKAU_G00355280 [Synaphobranchus kaupii]|uniref:Rieske domain-containing protein n=1 Tax=Synaphobranchus kaupii TaxID=118154 RepID=A0A9Q1EH99_SYNKA|nr:hypothetical protein SKAU_G00355280 [Synaphobranchus kaupii]
MMPMEENSDEAPASYFIGKKKDIIKAKRVSKFMNGRDVLVLYHEGKFYAMDAHCYHAGGQLENGDIEEFNYKLCIVCPSHKYKITLAEGEGLDSALDPKEKNPVPLWFSKGIKQRVHTVLEVEGDIFIKMSEVQGWIESDYYQKEQQRQERQKCAQICAAD